MHTPQIIWAILTLAGLLISIGEHGKPKTGMHDARAVLITTLLNIALLQWGGFFG